MFCWGIVYGFDVASDTSISRQLFSCCKYINIPARVLRRVQDKYTEHTTNIFLALISNHLQHAYKKAKYICCNERKAVLQRKRTAFRHKKRRLWRDKGNILLSLQHNFTLIKPISKMKHLFIIVTSALLLVATTTAQALEYTPPADNETANKAIAEEN